MAKLMKIFETEGILRRFFCNFALNMVMGKTDKSKYYLFIDECGDHNLAKYDPGFPVFTLCGILVSRQNLNALT